MSEEEVIHRTTFQHLTMTNNLTMTNIYTHYERDRFTVETIWMAQHFTKPLTAQEYSEYILAEVNALLTQFSTEKGAGDE